MFWREWAKPSLYNNSVTKNSIKSHCSDTCVPLRWKLLKQSKVSWEDYDWVMIINLLLNLLFIAGITGTLNLKCQTLKMCSQAQRILVTSRPPSRWPFKRVKPRFPERRPANREQGLAPRRRRGGILKMRDPTRPVGLISAWSCMMIGLIGRLKWQTIDVVGLFRHDLKNYWCNFP